MDYEDFYDLAVYANDAWKGSYTQKEVAVNAYNYMADFEYTKKRRESVPGFKELVRLLKEDGSDDAKYWMWRIECAINGVPAPAKND